MNRNVFILFPLILVIATPFVVIAFTRNAAGKHAKPRRDVSITKTILHKDAHDLAAPCVTNLFKDEYEIIKIAANRNNCKGKDFLLLLAIRKAENGGPGKEFGIVHPKAWNTNLNIQAGWAAATIVKNRVRWNSAGKKTDFIAFLGNRYAPVGATNDSKNLNKNWITNVTYWYNKLNDICDEYESTNRYTKN